MLEPLVYAACVNPDITYLHEAMKAPDHDQFKKAVDKELKDRIACKHWKVVPRSEVPKQKKVLDMVWAMRHKRYIDMCEGYKWKGRLNVHGGQQQHGIYYWETYAPVITWQTIQFFFILAIIMVVNQPKRLDIGIYSSPSRSPFVHEVSSRIRH